MLTIVDERQGTLHLYILVLYSIRMRLEVICRHFKLQFVFHSNSISVEFRHHSIIANCGSLEPKQPVFLQVYNTIHLTSRLRYHG